MKKIINAFFEWIRPRPSHYVTCRYETYSNIEPNSHKYYLVRISNQGSNITPVWATTVYDATRYSKKEATALCDTFRILQRADLDKWERSARYNIESITKTQTAK